MVDIKQLRKNVGLTQLQLAEKVGCSRATVAGWERRKDMSPHIRYIKALAKALKVPVKTFL